LGTGSLSTSNYGNYYFDTIIGPAATISVSGQVNYIKNITCNSFTDYATVSLTLGVFKINTFISSRNTVNLIAGSIANYNGYSYSLINLGQNVMINAITITDATQLNIASTTDLTDLYFNGGTIAQTDSSGIFKISNTTFLTSYYTKYINTNTVLHTKYLDCTKCNTPDCALRITDWNHIIAEQTFGCII